ncbi:unnamed protein product [Paramecium sonneborni]|uniref:Uncharacterized protein n=1 Tax=Paramecium sonneborni TaxID=65129 RepID=A0A8S1R1M4_9CILI|nr:unnamed protein product [Paramecium sonneborni]
MILNLKGRQLKSQNSRKEDEHARPVMLLENINVSVESLT